MTSHTFVIQTNKLLCLLHVLHFTINKKSAGLLIIIVTRLMYRNIKWVDYQIARLSRHKYKRTSVIVIDPNSCSLAPFNIYITLLFVHINARSSFFTIDLTRYAFWNRYRGSVWIWLENIIKGLVGQCLAVDCFAIIL